MANASFFEKKEVFERGVAEVRTLLRGRDVTTVPRTECGALSAKYEHLATLARELCDLSRTSSSKERYYDFAVRLSEHASTLKLLAAGKSPKSTPDEKRRTLLEEFELRRQDIKTKKVDDIEIKRHEFETLRAELVVILKRRKYLSEFSEEERGVLCQKYSKIASVAREISKRSVNDEERKKFAEYAEKLTKRAQEFGSIAKAEECARAPQKEAEVISSSYEKLIRAYQTLEEGALSDAEREEYAYFIRYFTESAEFFEAVRKKEIKTLSPDEILSLQTK